MRERIPCFQSLHMTLNVRVGKFVCRYPHGKTPQTGSCCTAEILAPVLFQKAPRFTAVAGASSWSDCCEEQRPRNNACLLSNKVVCSSLRFSDKNATSSNETLLFVWAKPRLSLKRTEFGHLKNTKFDGVFSRCSTKPRVNDKPHVPPQPSVCTINTRPSHSQNDQRLNQVTHQTQSNPRKTFPVLLSGR